VQSIEAAEPHIPWNWGFLKIRNACYTAAQHPLAEKSQSDLVDYAIAEPGVTEKISAASIKPAQVAKAAK
jgi:hypothetical protein